MSYLLKYKLLQSYIFEEDWVIGTLTPGVNYFKITLGTSLSTHYDTICIQNNSPLTKDLILNNYRYIIGTVDYTKSPNNSYDTMSNDILGHISRYTNHTWKRFKNKINIKLDNTHPTYIYMIGSNVEYVEDDEQYYIHSNIKYLSTNSTSEVLYIPEYLNFDIFPLDSICNIENLYIMGSSAGILTLSDGISISGDYGSLYWGELQNKWSDSPNLNGYSDKASVHHPVISFCNTYCSNASELSLFKNTSSYCYFELFSGSTIKNIPTIGTGSFTRDTIAATEVQNNLFELTDYCCKYMYKNCTQLANGNAFSDSNLINFSFIGTSCCEGMFEGCNNLTNITLPISATFKNAKYSTSGSEATPYIGTGNVSNYLSELALGDSALENIINNCYNLSNITIDFNTRLTNDVIETAEITYTMENNGRMPQSQDFANALAWWDTSEFLFDLEGVGPFNQVNKLIVNVKPTNKYNINRLTRDWDEKYIVVAVSEFKNNQATITVNNNNYTIQILNDNTVSVKINGSSVSNTYYYWKSIYINNVESHVIIITNALDLDGVNNFYYNIFTNLDSHGVSTDSDSGTWFYNYKTPDIAYNISNIISKANYSVSPGYENISYYFRYSNWDLFLNNNTSYVNYDDSNYNLMFPSRISINPISASNSTTMVNDVIQKSTQYKPDGKAYIHASDYAFKHYGSSEEYYKENSDIIEFSISIPNGPKYKFKTIKGTTWKELCQDISNENKPRKDHKLAYFYVTSIKNNESYEKLHSNVDYSAFKLVYIEPDTEICSNGNLNNGVIILGNSASSLPGFSSVNKHYIYKTDSVYIDQNYESNFVDISYKYTVNPNYEIISGEYSYNCSPNDNISSCKGYYRPDA